MGPVWKLHCWFSHVAAQNVFSYIICVLNNQLMCFSLTELEDVDLPSCSQIVSKGLPILNETGLLVKKNKPQHQASSRFASRADSLAGMS